MPPKPQPGRAQRRSGLRAYRSTVRPALDARDGEVGCAAAHPYRRGRGRFMESPHSIIRMHWDHEPKLEAPNLKTQIPNKSKMPRMQCSKQNRVGHLNLGSWNLFGIWCLEPGNSTSNGSWKALRQPKARMPGAVTTPACHSRASQSTARCGLRHAPAYRANPSTT